MWYLDTSAIAKLVQPERETAALRRWLGRRDWVISDLHRTELRRAACRVGPIALARAERLLGEADTIAVRDQVFDAAGRLDPPAMRSLDALHLAVARTLGPDLSGIVAYDRRLLLAAQEHGLTVVSPS